MILLSQENYSFFVMKNGDELCSFFYLEVRGCEKSLVTFCLRDLGDDRRIVARSLRGVVSLESEKDVILQCSDEKNPQEAPTSVKVQSRM